MLERVTVRVVAFALQKNNAATLKVVPVEAAEEPIQKMARHDLLQRTPEPPVPSTVEQKR